MKLSLSTLVFILLFSSNLFAGPLNSGNGPGNNGSPTSKGIDITDKAAVAQWRGVQDSDLVFLAQSESDATTLNQPTLVIKSFSQDRIQELLICTTGGALIIREASDIIGSNFLADETEILYHKYPAEFLGDHFIIFSNSCNSVKLTQYKRFKRLPSNIRFDAGRFQLKGPLGTKEHTLYLYGVKSGTPSN